MFIDGGHGKLVIMLVKMLSGPGLPLWWSRAAIDLNPLMNLQKFEGQKISGPVCPDLQGWTRRKLFDLNGGQDKTQEGDGGDVKLAIFSFNKQLFQEESLEDGEDMLDLFGVRMG